MTKPKAPGNRANGGRLREILAILARHDIARGLTPQKLCAILEDLGPTFVKLGQIMSMRPDMLPADYCRALTRLRVDVCPMPFAQVRRVVEAEYGRPLEEVFQTMEETHLGAASIAQVHRARLLDGREVAVKVQRPGVHQTMAQDIALLHKAAGLTKLAPVSDTVDLNMVLDEMWAVAQQEMDFLREAANADEFRQYNEGVAYVTCPAVLHGYTTARVLVMEYIGGFPIDDKEALQAGGYDREEIGLKLADNYIKQVLDDGFFHADPHPGNLRILGGKIVWLDLGMMGRLPRRDREILQQGVKAVAKNDADELTEAVAALCDANGPVEYDQLREELAAFLARYGKMELGRMNFTQTSGEMMAIAQRNHLAMPAGVSMLGRGMINLEGLLVDLSPELNLMQILAARMKDSLLRDLDWGREARKGARRLLESGYKAVDIPAQVSDLLRAAGKGQVRVNCKLADSQRLGEGAQRIAARLIQCLLVVGLFIGSSLLCATGLRPRLWGVPAAGLAGMAAALLGAIGLLWSLHKHT